jgi:NAD-dependent deacetylase
MGIGRHLNRLQMAQDILIMIGMKNTEPIQQAIDLIRKARRIVALSGAGISTEAGIPDFRGPGGMWEDVNLMAQMTASGFNRNPEGFYRASTKLFSTIGRAEPTLAHRLLARLEDMGKMEAVVTQNIDGLHRAAGSRKVFELHGTFRTGHCTKCGAQYDMAEFYAEIESGRLQAPLCAACNAVIKPDVVLFEDLLPVDAWDGAVQAVNNCDLLLVLGSSLVVYPAAELPMIAHANGAPLVIVNLERTDFDGLAAVTVQSRLGDFAQAALTALSQ